ncbi:F-box/kelch-repeat protein At3g04660-like [Castanea sativa]|uniref:F-box/kelch-repeat protein At3g04660-like n=1 Tax=Castanea sativa TaxID=21020 RepID=UPI003F6501CB
MVSTVLTIGSNMSWREVNHVPPPADSTKCGIGGKSGICVNGAIHWLTMYGDSIVAFDLKDENFRLIPLPHDLKKKKKNSAPFRLEFERLVELHGCLALVADVYSGVEADYMLQLWMLKDYLNHVWVMKTILFPFECSDCGQPVPIGTIPTGEILLKPRSLSKSPAWLLFYNTEGHCFKKVEITGLPEWVYSGGPQNIRSISIYGRTSEWGSG